MRSELRADLVDTLLTDYAEACGDDVDHVVALTDLLTDLMHWCAREYGAGDTTFDMCLECATTNFKSES